ncbi:EXD3, partial [Symbiodinium sp. CCMP2456]
WCRRLLFPGKHPVLAFSRHEDIRRLQRVGLLPPEDPGWIDLQDRFGPGSAPPGLQAVVAGTLGRWMDKSLQTSDWDVRPLSPEQKAYAALDASVLLLLHRCEVPLAPSWQVKPQPAKQPAEATMDAVKERWLQYRAQPSRLRTRLLEGGAREKNSDLCFILPAALTRLMRKMRGLGLDTEILKEGAPQGDLVESAEADDRIILYYQAKKLLPARVAHRTYVLQSSAPDEQLREVIEAFDVDVDSDCLCGRCVQCNAWDWNLVDRDAVRGNPQVAEKTLENFDEFWLCGGCGKIYWEGCSQHCYVAFFGEAYSKYQTLHSEIYNCIGPTRSGNQGYHINHSPQDLVFDGNPYLSIPAPVMSLWFCYEATPPSSFEFCCFGVLGLGKVSI